MLIRMLPDQVVEAWDFYKPMISAALPSYVEGNQQAITNIVTAISLDYATVWVYIEDDELVGVIVTYIHSHDLTRQKQLEIYAVYAVKPLTPERYQEALETLKRYGRHNGCQVILGYVSNAVWARFLRARGAQIDHLLVEIPL